MGKNKKNSQALSSKTLTPTKGPKDFADDVSATLSSVSQPDYPVLEPPTAASTVAERTRYRYHATNPGAARLEQVGYLNLTPTEKAQLATAFAIKAAARSGRVAPIVTPAGVEKFKENKEFWKRAAELDVPSHPLESPIYDWGRDSDGRDIGTYSVSEFTQCIETLALGTAQLLKEEREREEIEGELEDEPEDEMEQEVNAQSDNVEATDTMNQTPATFEGAAAGSREKFYAPAALPSEDDPLWEDVVPIPAPQPVGTLAEIMYPPEYAQALGYLRAVMAADEHTPRCLQLTDNVIEMNPSHYTVWLYRFSIIASASIPYQWEFEWLDQVALRHLKNYQIWHHRQALLDWVFTKVIPSAEAEPEKRQAEVQALARSEIAFLKKMLAEDSKNYHVWSYRQHLVRVLGISPKEEPLGSEELAATMGLIDADVRNNSAWAHLVYLNFWQWSAADAEAPAELIDAEIERAKTYIRKAPQNQSAWNYLQGVLARGKRPLKTQEAFANEFFFVKDPTVTAQSTHAAAFLADCAELDENQALAYLCWDWLALKGDPVRAGYWRWRKAGYNPGKTS